MKIIEIVADNRYSEAIHGIASELAIDAWMGPVAADGRQVSRILLKDKNVQQALDLLQDRIANPSVYRILVIPVEATLPRPPPSPPAESSKTGSSTSTSREALYTSIEKGSRLNPIFLLLVLLSTIVVAIGLIEDNVAVVIGAMVIAPLLGPNLALALGSALGDKELIRQALLTNLVGLSLAIGLSVLIGLLWPVSLDSRELLARTDVGLDSVALALASGAAAVLSVTTGLSSVLVGVMVAVALLPPSATFGLMMGAGQYPLAEGALILLAVNIVCVNLAAKIVFLLQGVRPRTWLEKMQARQSMQAYVMIWIVSLLLLLVAIYLRR